MKQILLAVTILLTVTTQLHAQAPDKKEKIKTLFAVMHQDSLMIKTIDAMTSSMVKNMGNIFNDTTYTNHGIDVSELMQKLMEKSMQKSKEMALNLLNNDMVDIYDKYFTGEEIDDFTTFYKSKSGQKMLTQMPAITKDLMTVMTTKYQPDFQESFMKEVQEITDEVKEQKKVKQN